MAYNSINLGNQPNDGLGDGLRTGGAKINTMFQELYYQRFVRTMGGMDYIVERTGFDAADQAPTLLKVNDRISGFTNAQRTRYVDGIVLDATLSVPGDFNDKTKFFKLIDKQVIS